MKESERVIERESRCDSKLVVEGGDGNHQTLFPFSVVMRSADQSVVASVVLE